MNNPLVVHTQNGASSVIMNIRPVVHHKIELACAGKDGYSGGVLLSTSEALEVARTLLRLSSQLKGVA